MSDIKNKQVFDDDFHNESSNNQQEHAEPLQKRQTLNSEHLFEKQQTQLPSSLESEENNDELEYNQSDALNPKGSSWLMSTMLVGFSGLVGWELVDSVATAWQTKDWLSLGWAGFAGVAAGIVTWTGVREFLYLRQLKKRDNLRESANQYLDSASISNCTEFLQKNASEQIKQSKQYQQWQTTLQPHYLDGEVVDLYDRMVLVELDKRASEIIAKHSTESALMVAISPLAITDMALVLWRNVVMVNQLSKLYGVELGYWSRIRLIKSVFKNMALAGASELAIDASIDLMSVDLAGKLSARAGQGIAIGVMSARLGLNAVQALRPISWRQETKLKLSTIRKQIVAKVASISLK